MVALYRADILYSCSNYVPSRGVPDLILILSFFCPNFKLFSARTIDGRWDDISWKMNRFSADFTWDLAK